MICCYMLHARLAATASAALSMFGSSRTHNGKGVTIPSQRRYVQYYEQQLLSPPPDQVLVLEKLKIMPLPDFNLGGGCEPVVAVSKRGQRIFLSKPVKGAKSKSSVEIDCSATVVSKDINIEVFNKQHGKPMFHVWLHCSFIAHNKVVLWKRDIDGASKDEKHFPANFKIELFFSQVADDGETLALKPRPPSSDSSVPSVAEATAAIERRAGAKRQDSASSLVPATPASAASSSAENPMAGIERRSMALNEKCGVCAQRILPTEFGLIVGNKPVHLACANCSKCRQPIGAREAIMGEDGTLQCGRCVLDFFDNCTACGEQLVQGASSTVGGKVYHRHCIKCHLCTRSLQWAGFREMNGVPICPDGCRRSVEKPSPIALEGPTSLGIYSDDDGADGKLADDPDSDDDDLAAKKKPATSRTPPAAHKNSCSICGINLQGRTDVFRENGQLFCQLDYNILMSDACAHCKKPILTTAVAAGGNRYHAEHVFCSICAQACTSGFAVVDGDVYCTQHAALCRQCTACTKQVTPKSGLVEFQGFPYHRTCLETYRNCRICQQVISPPDLTIQSGASYHRACIAPPTPTSSALSLPSGGSHRSSRAIQPAPQDPPRRISSPSAAPAPAPAPINQRLCSKCKQPVKGEYLEMAGQFMHHACFTCPTCKQPLSGAFVEIEGVAYHRDCFVCFSCKRPFPGGQFIPQDGKNYCAGCYETLSPLCSGCLKAILNGVFYTIGSHKFHESCFVCSMCQLPFPAGRYYSVADRHVCASCLAILQKQHEESQP
eukprot:TRINITY_DN219_c1_g1_i4.p1 TRINITY_DN219_c1_g1~~TRINITY_DN219_c1_g1_i4.p1  ORF type:complete len:911 (+),score=157.61 TRINITY_DN219_c1_g1_i4:404-2734(+)